MKCPKCSTHGIIAIHTEAIDCHGCGGKSNIEYCICTECEYSFRLNNGVFMDEMNMACEEDLVEAFEGLIDAFDVTPSSKNKNMADMLQPCVRCGEFFVSANAKNTHYRCASCDFEWEILRGE